MSLTAEIMDQEAEQVAEGIAAIIVAGMTPDQEPGTHIGSLLGQGMRTFGDVQAGIDDDANRTRFGMKVGAKVTDALADVLLPLTEV